MRRPKLERGQEIEFQKQPGLAGLRYKGRVKTVTGDAVEIEVTDDRWTAERRTIVRLRDVIDPTTGQRFAYKHLTPASVPAQPEATAVPSSEAPTLPQPAPPVPAEREEPSDTGPIFGKNDLDAWLAMGKDLLENIDAMVEEKKGEILIMENQMKELADQRNTALNDIKDLEARKAMLTAFYKDRR